MKASPIHDTVIQALYGALCDGNIEALGDIENRNGEIQGRNLKVPCEYWETCLSEAEFAAAYVRHRVFRLPNTEREPLFLVNARIEATALDAWLSPQPHAPGGAKRLTPSTSTDQQTTPPQSAIPKRQRGRKPIERYRVKGAILEDVKNGQFTLQELRVSEKQVAMATRYNTTRYTFLAALRELLSELGPPN
jgi:hypothetical protein